MYLGIQVVAEIDPAKREEIERRVTEALTGHDCETSPAEECNLSWFATKMHDGRDDVADWVMGR